MTKCISNRYWMLFEKKIESFTAGTDRPTLGADEKTQSAVIMQLMLIGEISKNFH